MTNKQKLEHALAFGYPVKVVWKQHSIQSEEQGIVFHTMLNGFKFHGDDSKYNYVYIVSVEPLEPEVEKKEGKEKATKHTLTIAFDFDGVLAQYTGWKGYRELGDPVPGMSGLLMSLWQKGCKIIIFTTRGNSEVAEWCKKHGMPYDWINHNPNIQGNNPGKPIADVYVDDRSIRFDPSDMECGVLESQILNFEPWWHSDRENDDDPN